MSLTVDGYQGAWVYKGAFDVSKDKESIQPLSRPVVRIDAPRFSRSTPKLPVTLVLDDNLDDVKQVRLGVLSSVEKDEKTNKEVEVYAKVAEFSGPRQENVRYARGGPGGALVFEPEVKYWSTTLEVTNTTKLRLEALDRTGKVVSVLDGGTPGLEEAKDGVTHLIRVDDTPPRIEDVEFVRRPRQVVRGVPFPILARAVDPESGISKVRFYLGKAVPEDKLPPDAVDAVLGEEEIWGAELKVPAGYKDPTIQVNVVAFNGVNLATTKSIEVRVDPGAGKISGKVLEKNQPVENQMVLLINSKNEIEDRVTSGKEGVYVFENVPKGAYRLVARRTNTKVRAERIVVVKTYEPILDQHLIMEEPTTISGRVIEDEVPIENQVVALFTDKDLLRAKVRTTAGGQFIFEDVVRGKYVIRVVRPETRTVAEVPIEVKRLEPIKGVEVELRTPKGTAVISGKVLEADVGVADVRIELINANDEVIDQTRSGAGGKFAFKALGNGVYRLRGARPSTPSNGEVEVAIRNLTSVKGVELVLRRAQDKKQRITGVVVEGDRPQAGVAVQLLAMNNVILGAVTTNAEGGFAFDNVPIGSYRILATKTSSRTTGLVNVDVADGVDLKGVQVKLFRR